MIIFWPLTGQFFRDPIGLESFSSNLVLHFPFIGVNIRSP